MHLKGHGISSVEYKEKFGPTRTPQFLALLHASALKGGSSPAATAVHKQKAHNRRAEYNKSPNKCNSCNEPLAFLNRRNTFCSHRCSAINTNKTRSVIRNITNAVAIFRGECKYCNSQLFGRSRTYCNRVCQSHYEFEKILCSWGFGEYSGGTSFHLNKKIRLFLIDQADCKCTRCGWGKINPNTNSYPLQVDHINGNSTDHSPDNLRVLCPNCHSLTSTFGSPNRANNKGRPTLIREALSNKPII
jgi:Zn finger protein HypA/HybF involved in hydrogenase expression